MEIPLGFRFFPEPQDCIQYLHYKVMGSPLPCHGFILDLSPYNINHLPHIFTAAENRGQVYLYTNLSKKGRIGYTNINRKVGKGVWHGNQKGKVKDKKTGREIGKSTNLSYQEKGSNNDKRFLMIEYTLSEHTYDPLKDYVLCHIYKNPRWKNGHNSSNQETVVLHAPSPAPAESISSLEELEVELANDLPSTSASGSVYHHPPAMEASYFHPSNETAFAPSDYLDALLPNNSDIDSWFNDPFMNECFEFNTNSSNQETVVLQAPSPAADESISSFEDFEMELATYMPYSAPSRFFYVEPLAMEAAYSQPSIETTFAPDILDTLLVNRL